jgi:hypothetical protein
MCLLGPPLDMFLDSQIVKNCGHLIRSGCGSNAVIRSVLCWKPKGGQEH